jgi:hypothetical protein
MALNLSSLSLKALIQHDKRVRAEIKRRRKEAIFFIKKTGGMPNPLKIKDKAEAKDKAEDEAETNPVPKLDEELPTSRDAEPTDIRNTECDYEYDYTFTKNATLEQLNVELAQIAWERDIALSDATFLKKLQRELDDKKKFDKELDANFQPGSDKSSGIVQTN